MISPAQLKLIAACEVVAMSISDAQAEQATRYLMSLPAQGGVDAQQARASELEEGRQARELGQPAGAAEEE
jgi:hypothetical protein